MTPTEIAQTEFQTVKVLHDMTKDRRIRRMHELVNNVRPMAVIAGEIVAMTNQN